MESERLWAVGEAVRKARKEMGLTQEKLSELLGKGEGYIGKVEQARITMGLDSAFDIIDVLNIDANTLLGIKRSDSIDDMLSELTPTMQEYFRNTFINMINNFPSFS